MIRCHCQVCRAALELPDHLAGSPFACPSCGQTFTVPRAEAHRQGFMERLLHASENPRAAAVPFPPPTAISRAEPVPDAAPAPAPALPAAIPDSPPPPVARAGRDWDDRPQRDDFYDDDDHDGDDSYGYRPRRGTYSREYAVRSALYGMICSMAGLVGILIGFFVFLFNSRRGQGGLGLLETTLLILSLGSLLSFIFTLMGVIFSSRGLDQSNDHNRGMAVAGLVLGIIGLVLSVLVGFFTFFCGMMLRVMPF